MTTATTLNWVMCVVGAAGLLVAILSTFFPRYLLGENGKLKRENTALERRLKESELQQAASDARLSQVAAERAADRAHAEQLEQQKAAVEANFKQVSESLAASDAEVSRLEQQNAASEKHHKQARNELGTERAKASGLEQKLVVAATWEARYREKQSDLEKLRGDLTATTRQRDTISLDGVGKYI